MALSPGKKKRDVTLCGEVAVDHSSTICFLPLPPAVYPQRVIAKYSDEEETLRKMLQANPNDAVAHNNLGVLMETVHKVIHMSACNKHLTVYDENREH